jgi:NAD(P)-dependent dehydrogenase (short-subunit alcohol dehydrogenase family)
LNFNNKTVLVTGGSRGIGRAVALSFANSGANVCITYISNEAEAKATIDLLPSGNHRAFQADIQNPEAIRILINKIAITYDGLDIVVNNAGIFESHPIDRVTYPDWQESWQKTIGVNLIGPANVCYCAAQYMMLRGGGRIINISSRGAFRGEPQQPAYGASKAGLNAMSQSLAQALAPYNIFVGVVAPGFVDTDMAKSVLNGPDGQAIKNQSPLGRVAQPMEVAKAVLFLASEGTEFMTGAIIDVNGASYLRS